MQNIAPHRCSRCDGDGSVRCGQCDGTGKVEARVTVGPVSYPARVPCIACLGQGKKMCGKCFGTGYEGGCFGL
ncbi:unnamed protein product [Rotaria magnacalcarata]|uniref:BSD2 cysteine rich domain-containing protein n=1 Tax=Rotaria magnacalcarata TaxID=392030 RepID=A0A816SZZ5_9BILA|nr:unnamed protein product [Rotaria magnacalcarata]CAF2093259.1 unnamed protein product [Rotaria magnacalcarata]